MEHIFQTINTRVTGEMNQTLDKEFTILEVKSTFCQMNPNKAQGLDGMIVCFYQNYWDIIGRDFCQVVYNFLTKIDNNLVRSCQRSIIQILF